MRTWGKKSFFFNYCKVIKTIFLSEKHCIHFVQFVDVVTMAFCIFALCVWNAQYFPLLSVVSGSTCWASWSTRSPSYRGRREARPPASSSSPRIGRIGWRWPRNHFGPKSPSWPSAAPCWACSQSNHAQTKSTTLEMPCLSCLRSLTFPGLRVRSWLASAGSRAPGWPGRPDITRPPSTRSWTQRTRTWPSCSPRRPSGFGPRWDVTKIS